MKKSFPLTGNIFPYGIRHALTGHSMRVRSNTITEDGVAFMCTKCLAADYMAWTTPMQRINAQVYLQFKNSAVLAAIKYQPHP